MLLIRQTHEKLSLARAEPPSTDRQEPFRLVYPKWLELPMADCAMQAALLLDWLGEISIPFFPSKPCNRVLAQVSSPDNADCSCFSAQGGQG